MLAAWLLSAAGAYVLVQFMFLSFRGWIEHGGIAAIMFYESVWMAPALAVTAVAMIVWRGGGLVRFLLIWLLASLVWVGAFRVFAMLGGFAPSMRLVWLGAMPSLSWLITVPMTAIAALPCLLAARFLWLLPRRTPDELAAGASLFTMGLIVVFAWLAGYFLVSDPLTVLDARGTLKLTASDARALEAISTCGGLVAAVISIAAIWRYAWRVTAARELAS